MSRPFKTRLDQLQGRKNVAIAALETAAAFTLRLLNMGDRRLFPLSLAAGQAMTLPFATGKGGCYRLFVQTTYTGNATIVTQAGNNPKTGARDAFYGTVAIGGTTTGQFGATGSSHTITMNGSTTGGLAGSYIEIEDVAPGVWRIDGTFNGSGTVATPLS
jgi:hypothetical protein